LTNYPKVQVLPLFLIVSFCLLLAGCASPLKKPDIGPTGRPAESKPNPPILERFHSAPDQLYDLEAIAGATFEGINKENWPKAEEGLNNLRNTWEESKKLVGDKKGVNEADEALTKLSTNIESQQATAAYLSLNHFMSSVSDIGKSYKLSPLSDIVTISNSLRDVSFYVEDNNWLKASAKAKELDDTWSQAKPALEQFGILSEVTKTHAAVKQLRDAVGAENKGKASEQLTNLNSSMGTIRDYYRGK
jgi:hypothetical protein